MGLWVYFVQFFCSWCEIELLELKERFLVFRCIDLVFISPKFGNSIME